MGWVVWLLESALCLAASYALAVAVYPERGVLDRVIATLLIDATLILVAIHLCGFAGRLDRVTLGVVAALLFMGTIAVAMRRMPSGALVAALRSDLRAPLRLARDAWEEREPAVGVFVPAAMAAGTCATMVWYLRSWFWDPLWYHVPKTAYAIQEHSLRWVSTPIVQVQANPQHVELLALWNCIFQHDNRLDDSGQLSFLVLGAAVIAAWARRVGVSRPLAAAVGATWIALPPVFLQAHSAHVDVAWSAMFTAAVYFTVGRPERRDRWMGFVAWGLFLGTKYTGPFHLALFAPYLVARALVEVFAHPRRDRWRALGDVALSACVAPLLGLPKYVQNLLHTGNPMFPFELRVPVLGIQLHGPNGIDAEFGGGPGGNPAFFGTPRALHTLLASWYDADLVWAPVVMSGGFGPVFCWLLVFVVAALACDVLRGREVRRGLLPLFLFVESLQLPIPYVTRLVIGAGSASLVAFAIVHSGIRARLPRLALSLALVGLTWAGYRDAYRGFIVYPRYLDRARAASVVERASLQVDSLLWPTRWALARERELAGGGVIAYDESVLFLGDLFNHDYGSRVVFVSSGGDPGAYVRRLGALRARWVGVTRRSPAERALVARGAEFLFVAPISEMAVYRVGRR